MHAGLCQLLLETSSWLSPTNSAPSESQALQPHPSRPDNHSIKTGSFMLFK